MVEVKVEVENYRGPDVSAGYLILYISDPARRKQPSPKSSKFGMVSKPTGWLSEGCLPVPWTYPRKPFG